MPLLKKSGVIYSIPGGDCPDAYVGETCQYLDKRLNSHKSDVRHNKDTTALACHVAELNHKFNFNDVSVLAYEKNNVKRKIREVVEIINNSKSINFKSDSGDMQTFYAHVISTSKSWLCACCL